MFELPEYLRLAGQIAETLAGKTVEEGTLGNSPHKFVWHNRSPDEFAELVRDRTVGETRVMGRWMAVDLNPGFVLLLGECGGRILYHEAGAPWPEKYHLSLSFTDGSFFTVTTQMWGAMELYEAGKEREARHVKDQRPTPVDPAFTPAYLKGLIESEDCVKRSAKGILTQDQLIPGLGNAIAQDILFRARLHPKRSVQELSAEEVEALYNAVVTVLAEVSDAGGRNDETDLFGEPGGYVRIMDKDAPGRPCPRCGGKVMKMQYLGGACYFCSQCQS